MDYNTVFMIGIIIPSAITGGMFIAFLICWFRCSLKQIVEKEQREEAGFCGSGAAPCDVIHGSSQTALDEKSESSSDSAIGISLSDNERQHDIGEDLYEVIVHRPSVHMLKLPQFFGIVPTASGNIYGARNTEIIRNSQTAQAGCMSSHQVLPHMSCKPVDTNRYMSMLASDSAIFNSTMTVPMATRLEAKTARMHTFSHAVKLDGYRRSDEEPAHCCVLEFDYSLADGDFMDVCQDSSSMDGYDFTRGIASEDTIHEDASSTRTSYV